MEISAHIVHVAKADTDYSLGYIGDDPAVFTCEDGVDCGYIVPDSVIIYNQYEGHCWQFMDGHWVECAYGWKPEEELLAHDEITEGGPDWTEED